MGSAMRTSGSLKVLYELSPLAEELEKTLNIPIGLSCDDTFNSSFYLRAVSETIIVLDPIKITPVNTGVYIQITEPLYEFSVKPYMNLLRDKQVGAISTSFGYGYRNEIKILMYNYSKEKVIISPGDIISILSFNEIVCVETEKKVPIDPADSILKSKDHNWVQEEKNKSKIKQDTKIEIKNLEKLVETRLE